MTDTDTANNTTAKCHIVTLFDFNKQLNSKLKYNVFKSLYQIKSKTNKFLNDIYQKLNFSKTHHQILKYFKTKFCNESFINMFLNLKESMLSCAVKYSISLHVVYRILYLCTLLWLVLSFFFVFLFLCSFFFFFFVFHHFSFFSSN